MKNSPKYYVGMSGGVDSSVAAYLLKKAGYEVVGVYANCFYDDEQCRNSTDHADAVKVASILGIDLETKDYRQAYYDNVLSDFYSQYSKGRTPNPDILCNSAIKFGAMAQSVLGGNAHNYLATGHYVGNIKLSKNGAEAFFGAISQNNSSINEIISLLYSSSNTTLNFLMSGIDATKDQSYFLYKLYDETRSLANLVFPLSEMAKSHVRKIAEKAGLGIASKPDSQGICFIGNVKLRDFIKDHIKATPGKVFDKAGNKIGTHAGVQFYTIGQRHGFQLSTYSKTPLYIVSKNLSENTLVVGSRQEAYTKKFLISDISFPYNIEKFLEKFNETGLSVRVRNLGRKIPCKVIRKDNLESSGFDLSKVSQHNFEKINFGVELAEPEFGVSSGQSAVFYIDRLMLGGGVIETI